MWYGCTPGRQGAAAVAMGVSREVPGRFLETSRVCFLLLLEECLLGYHRNELRLEHAWVFECSCALLSKNYNRRLSGALTGSYYLKTFASKPHQRVGIRVRQTTAHSLTHVVHSEQTSFTMCRLSHGERNARTTLIITPHSLTTPYV